MSRPREQGLAPFFRNPPGAARRAGTQGTQGGRKAGRVQSEEKGEAVRPIRTETQKQRHACLGKGQEAVLQGTRQQGHSYLCPSALTGALDVRPGETPRSVLWAGSFDSRA